MNGIFALDPGNKQTGWVLLKDGAVADSGVHPNHDVLRWVQEGQGADVLAIEMMRARGMLASNDAFETLVWVGRFKQAWRDPEAVALVYREDVKLHVCGDSRAKDKNIRAALLDLIGTQGNKCQPGPTYGVASHAWAALGVAVTARDRMA